MRRLYFDWLLTCLISHWAVKTIASSPSSVLATWGKTDVLLNKVTCHQPFGKQGKRKKEYLIHLLHKSPAYPSLLTCQERCFFMSCYECGPIIFNWKFMQLVGSTKATKSNLEEQFFKNNLFISSIMLQEFCLASWGSSKRNFSWDILNSVAHIILKGTITV